MLHYISLSKRKIIKQKVSWNSGFFLLNLTSFIKNVMFFKYIIYLLFIFFAEILFEKGRVEILQFQGTDTKPHLN